MNADNELMVFARNLRRVRESRGMTQAKLAEVTDVKPSAISRYEGGGAIPSIITAKSMARALKCSIDDLAGYDYIEEVIGVEQDVKEQLRKYRGGTPIKCGCGYGKPIVYETNNGDEWVVECTHCGIKTRTMLTKAGAILVWNQAMGGLVQKAYTPACEDRLK